MSPSSIVYFIQANNGGPVKIGHTADLATRLATMRAHCPFPLAVLCTVPGGRIEEKALHLRFAADRSHFEWFAPSPALVAHIELLGGSVGVARAWDPALDMVRDATPAHVVNSTRVKAHLSIGVQVRALRLAQCISQETLAARAGLLREEISKLERGHNLGTRFKMRQALAHGFGLSLENSDRFLAGSIDVTAALALTSPPTP